MVIFHSYVSLPEVMTLCNKCQPQIIIHHWAAKKTGFGAISETHFFGVPPNPKNHPGCVHPGLTLWKILIEDYNIILQTNNIVITVIVMPKSEMGPELSGFWRELSVISVFLAICCILELEISPFWILAC